VNPYYFQQIHLPGRYAMSEHAFWIKKGISRSKDDLQEGKIASKNRFTTKTLKIAMADLHLDVDLPPQKRGHNQGYPY